MFHRVSRENRHLVINDPHDWVYWSWQFARRFPQPEPLDDRPLREHGEADTYTRQQPFDISNLIPTENVMIYRRSAYAEALAQRNEAIESIHSMIGSTLCVDPQPSCSSSSSASGSASSSNSQFSCAPTPLLPTMPGKMEKQMISNSSGGGSASVSQKQQSKTGPQKPGQKQKLATRAATAEATVNEQAELIAQLQAQLAEAKGSGQPAQTSETPQEEEAWSAHSWSGGWQWSTSWWSEEPPATKVKTEEDHDKASGERWGQVKAWGELPGTYG